MPAPLHRQAARALEAVPINVGFARAVVEGTVAGELWADRQDHPRAFHAVHPYGMSLVWGESVDEAADHVLARLRSRTAGEWLQVDPRSGVDWATALDAVPLTEHDEHADPGRVVAHTRVNFAFDRAAFTAARLGLTAPTGWHERPATAAEFTLPGAVVPSGFWPDAPAFLEHGGGWVVTSRETVGAIAFTSYRTADEVEIGIETAAAWRRRGLAAAAAAAMIEDLLARGLTPVWSCREDNVASLRLAIALGFRPTLRVPYLRIPPRA
ncbi:GNAT family N-acetyltransferase [Cellulomonas sp.]|uniref:GNAT family N-acetyltransferase n=1 Tax=Cellulomonas sp. TaxID=40001 RepID=UPI00258C0325|nr:GNAT family N-acetyltransferase [Cellulomonas sp.]MCR6688370.1 GNAT family N-acetyltransferase [Cellulomonas sp.]